jgi:hypothetical protein
MSGGPADADAARLSRLLFEAWEVASMYRDVVRHTDGRDDPWLERLVDEIEAYRAEQGWQPDGFGGEVVRPGSDPSSKP